MSWQQRLSVALCAFCLCTPPLSAQGRDHFGDPLPPGARARFGSSRFRVPGILSFVDYSTNGTFLVVCKPIAEALGEPTFRLLDRDTGRELSCLPIPCLRSFSSWPRGVYPHCLSWDGLAVADIPGVCDGDCHEVRVRELATGKAVFALKEKAAFGALRLSRNSKYLATMSLLPYAEGAAPTPALLRLFDVATGTELRRILLPADATAETGQHKVVPRSAYLYFSRDHRTVLVSGGETAYLWRWAEKGQLDRLGKSSGDYTFSPDDKQVAQIADGVLRLWDVRTGKVIREHDGVPEGSFHFDYFANGKLLGSGHVSEPKLCVWDAATGQPLGKRFAGLHSYQLAPAGASVATLDDEGIQIWDIGKDQAVPRFAAPVGPAAEINCRSESPIALFPDDTVVAAATHFGANRGLASLVTFSADGKLVASSGAGSVVVWNAATGQALHTLARAGERELAPPAHPLSPSCLAFAPDNTELAVGWDDGIVTVWSATTGKLLRRQRTSARAVTSLTYAGADTALLVSHEGDAVVRWEDGRLARSVALPTLRHEPPALLSAFAPGGTTAVLHFGSKGVLWEPATGLIRGELASAGRHVRFAPGGRLLASFNKLHIVLSDTRTGKEVRHFQMSGDIQDSAFSADGAYLAAASNNGKVRLWATATGTLQGELAAHEGGVMTLAFAPDGRSLLTSGADTTLLLWDLHAAFPTLRPATPLTASEAVALWEQLGAVEAAVAGQAMTRLARCQDAVILLEERLQPAGAKKPTVREKRRALRALIVLERLGTSKARALLQRLATGDPKALLTQEAHDACRRSEARQRASLASAQVAGNAEAHKDALGELLPAGAYRRLGARAFQHGASVGSIQYLADGRSIFSYAVMPDGGLALMYWDAAKGRLQLGHKVPAPTTLLDDDDAPVARSFQGAPGMAKLWSRPWSVSAAGKRLARVVALPQRHARDDDDELLILRVRNLVTGKDDFEITVPEGGFSKIQFSPDGKLLAALCRAAPIVRLYDLGRNKEQHFGRDEGEPQIAPQNLVFSPDGRRLAILATVQAEDKESVAYLWDLTDARPARQLLRKPGLLEGIAFFQDGKLVAVTEFSQREVCAGIWDADTGKRLHDLKKKDGGRAKAPRFSPDRTLLAVPHDDGVIIWSTTTGKELCTVPHKSVDEMVFAPDSRTLALHDGSVPEDGGWIYLYDVPSGKRLHKLTYFGYNYPSEQLPPGDDQAASFAFSPDGKVLAVARHNTISRWDVRTGRELAVSDHVEAAYSLALAAHGCLVVAGADHSVLLLDGTTGKLRRRLVPQWDGVEDNANLHVARVAVTPDGALVAAGTLGGLVFVWDAVTGKCLWKSAEEPIRFLKLTPDGRNLVVGATDGTLVWREAASGRVLRTVKMPERPPDEAALKHAPSVAVSADRQHAAILDQSLRLWEVASRGKRWELPTSASCQRIILAPNGRWLAVADQVGVRLHDVLDGRELRYLGGAGEPHLPYVYELTCSPDSRLVAVCGTDARRLWDAETGTVLADLEGHRGSVLAAAFSPEGEVLATLGADTTVVLWDVAALARRPPPAPLTSAELAALWERLADRDAAIAYEALCRLERQGSAAVALVRDCLRPAVADEALLTRLLEDLGHARFAIRERAMTELALLGEQAAPALRKVTPDGAPLEVRRRVEILLAKLAGPVELPAQARALRAVELLEHIGTKEARALLRELADGAPMAEVTRAARGALRRLGS
jgi:WD40 repeat protein